MSPESRKPAAGEGLRVIFVTYDGVELPTARVRCYRFAEELARRGFRTRVLSMRDHLGAPYHGAEQWRIGDTRKLCLIAKSLHALRGEAGSLLYLQKAHYHCYGPLLLQALGRNDLVLDYDDWDLAAHPFRASHFLPPLRAGALAFELARRARACVVSSKPLLDLLAPHARAVHLIPTGVDLGRFRPLPLADQGPLRLSWAGVVWGDEVLAGVRLLLEAFALAARQRPGAVRLLVAGGGERFPEVERELGALRAAGLDACSCGWYPPDEIERHYAAVDVGLVPLVNSTFARAKSPTKMFEYMACGRAIIASAIGEPRRILRDHGTGLLCDGPPAMARAIVELIDDRDLCRRLGRAARAEVEARYSLEVLGADLARLLAEPVVSSRPAPP